MSQFLTTTKTTLVEPRRNNNNNKVNNFDSIYNVSYGPTNTEGGGMNSRVHKSLSTAQGKDER